MKSGTGNGWGSLRGGDTPLEDRIRALRTEIEDIIDAIEMEEASADKE
jgi:hypothetical protein